MHGGRRLAKVAHQCLVGFARSVPKNSFWIFVWKDPMQSGTAKARTPALHGVLPQFSKSTRVSTHGLQIDEVVEFFHTAAQLVGQIQHYKLNRGRTAVFCSGRVGQRTGSKLDPLNHAAISDSR